VKLPAKIAVALLFSALTLGASATEVAILRNGFTIRHERRALLGANTRLFLSSTDETSFIDVPTAEIDRFEPDLTPPEAAPAPQVDRTQQGVVPPPSTPAAAAKLQAPQASMNVADAVNAASDRYRLDPDFVNSVIRAESGFNPRAVSRKGAQGLMQLMPETASQLGVANAFDPQSNVEGGTRYLRELLERYNYDMVKALAAYNAGTKRVEQYHGVPPYRETRAYVASIVKDFNKKKLAQQKAAKAAQATTAQTKPAVPASAPAQARKSRATSATQTVAKRTNAPSGN
jgi:soluble lytic murein transglycosylase-like protein